MKRVFQKIMSIKGFTLVEMLIAATLSSIVMIAGFTLFLSSNKVHHSSSQTSMLQQNARAALDLMAKEIHMAGLGTISPDEIKLLDEGQQDAQTVFNSGTVNNQVSSYQGEGFVTDVISFKANLGGMVIIVSDTTAAEIQSSACSGGGDEESTSNCGASVYFKHGHDLFQNGMFADILNLQRSLVGSGVIGNLAGVPVDRIVFASYTAVDAGNIETGSVIMQRPAYMTFQLIEGKLIRCLRQDYGMGCDLSFLNNKSTPGDPSPNTTYVLADSVADLQFSYLLDSGNEFLPTATQPLDLTKENMEKIRAVKIEILVKSKESDPMITSENCSSGIIKTKYYIGDRVNEVTCGHAYVQMSAIVRVPNSMSAASGS